MGELIRNSYWLFHPCMLPLLHCLSANKRQCYEDLTVAQLCTTSDGSNSSHRRAATGKRSHVLCHYGEGQEGQLIASRIVYDSIH